MPPAPDTAAPQDGPALPEICPSCNGPLEHGSVGTIGRVFSSHPEHFLGVSGDDVLIPVAVVRTGYRAAATCRVCSLVTFLYGDAGDTSDIEAAEAIVDDAMSAPEEPAATPTRK